MKPSFAIIGCGRLGKTLAKYLTTVGYTAAGFSSKSPVSAREAADVAGSGETDPIAGNISRLADLVFITTPDNQIESVCQGIAKNKGFKPGAVVMHCSGAHPSTILSSAKPYGAFIGSMHPLQSFTGDLDHTVSPFEGVVISVEGDEPAVALAQNIAADLKARCLRIQTAAKVLYHASAVVASNYLVTLLDLAFKLAAAAGIDEKDAPAMLFPLIEGTLANISTKGIRNALTGPIARGDVETVARHLVSIQKEVPDSLGLYKLLGRYTVEIAAAGNKNDSAMKGLKKVLTTW